MTHQGLNLTDRPGQYRRACLNTGRVRPRGVRHGSATLETVIMVTVVLLTVTTIASVVGVTIRNSFSHVATTVNAPSRPGGSRIAKSRQPTTQFASSVYSVPKTVWICLGVVTAFILNGVFWFLILRRTRSQHTQETQRDEPARKVEMGDDEIFAKRQKILHTLSSDLDALFGDRIQVRHFMSDTVKAVAPNMAADDVAKMMAENRILHLMVANNSRVLGIISDRNLRAKAATAANLMTSDPITVESTTPLMTAITIFLKHRISCLPVEEDGKLCGILTTTDLMMGLQASLQLLSKYSDRFKAVAS